MADTKRLHIAVDVTPIQPGGACGGAKPFVLELVRALARAPRRHEYRLLTAAHNHDEFAAYQGNGVTRQMIGVGVPPDSLRTSGTDLLFCPMTATTYAEPGIPTVSVLYDLQHLAYPWFFSASEFAHRLDFYRRLTERANHIVCISEFSRISLIRHLGVAPERTSVAPIAIERRLPRFETDAAWQRLAAHGLSPCRFAFYPANFWAHKNHRLLLVAFGRFVAEHPEHDLHLVLTGELLDEGEAVKAAVAGMGLSTRVHVLGFVSEEDLGALWQVATCLVFPSLFEGFGIPVAEAMYYGKPVLCSREGSLPEVGGEDVVYFDARNPQTLIDALPAVLDGSDAIRQKVARARERVAAYDVDGIAEHYLDVFERTAAPSRGAAPMISAERRSDGTLLTPLEAYAAHLSARLGGTAGAGADPAMMAAYQSALEASESDRAARLAVIHQQGAEVGLLHERIRSLERNVMNRLVRGGRRIRASIAGLARRTDIDSSGR